MIHNDTLKFLRELSLNNNKAWFDSQKELFEFAKNDFLNFVSQICEGIAKFDKDLQINTVDPKKCINRIYRDVRFSKDKTPYKTTMFAMINFEGRKSQKASYYLQIQPGDSFIGGGAYMPMAPDLKAFRQEIDYNFKEWQGIIGSENFKKFYPKGVEAYDRLVKAPKDFDAESPAIEYLKLKGYHAVSRLSDSTLTSNKAVDTVLVHCKIIHPMLAFLNKGFS